MLADFRALDTRKRFLTSLESDFGKHKALAIGSQAPDFRLLSASGDSVRLSSFQGKLVYLNFWKTTNGLCLRDLAYAQDLAKRFEGKNIVFVNVALDELEVPWRQLVTIKKLPGVHVQELGAPCVLYCQPDALLLFATDGRLLHAPARS